MAHKLKSFVQITDITFTATTDINFGVVLTQKDSSVDWDLKCYVIDPNTQAEVILFDTVNGKGDVLFISEFLGNPYPKDTKFHFVSSNPVDVYFTYKEINTVEYANQDNQLTTIQKLEQLNNAVGAIYSVLGTGAKEQTLQAFKTAVNDLLSDIKNSVLYIKDNVNNPVDLVSSLKTATGSIKCFVENMSSDANELNSILDVLNTIQANMATADAIHADLMSLKAVEQQILSAINNVQSILDSGTIATTTDVDDAIIIARLQEIRDAITDRIIVLNQYLNTKVINAVDVNVDWENLPAYDTTTDMLKVKVADITLDIAKDATLQQILAKLEKCNTDDVVLHNAQALLSFTNAANIPVRALVDDNGRLILSPQSSLAVDVQQKVPATEFRKFENINISAGASYMISINDPVMLIYSVRVNSYNKDTKIELLEKWPNESPTPFRVLEQSSTNENNYANFEYLPLRPRKLENYFGVRITNLSNTSQTYHVYVEVGVDV